MKPLGKSIFFFPGLLLIYVVLVGVVYIRLDPPKKVTASVTSTMSKENKLRIDDTVSKVITLKKDIAALQETVQDLFALHDKALLEIAALRKENQMFRAKLDSARQSSTLAELRYENKPLEVIKEAPPSKIVQERPTVQYQLVKDVTRPPSD